MKHFNRILSTLLIVTMTAHIFAYEDYEQDSSVFADPQEGAIFRNQELERDVRTRKPAEQPETPNFEARTTSKPGFFDRISNWSNKRTLSKAFADHAKNSAPDEDIFSKKNNEAMWKTLSKEDQKDLVNEWFKTHETKRQQELQKNRKKYESSDKDYESGTKKVTLARVDNSYKEIKKLQSEIDKLKAQRNETTNPSKQRNDLNVHIEALENKKETENENIKVYLTLIAKELNEDEKKYKKTHSETVKNQLKKMENFINSINKNEFSKIEAEVRKKSEQPSVEKQVESARLAEAVSTSGTQSEEDYNTAWNEYVKFESDKLALNRVMTVPELFEGRKLAEKALGTDSKAYKTWNNLYQKSLKEFAETAKKSKTVSQTPKEVESRNAVNNTENEESPAIPKNAADDDYESLKDRLEISRKKSNPQTGPSTNSLFTFDKLLALHLTPNEDLNPKPETSPVVNNDFVKENPSDMTTDAIEKEIEELNSQGEDNLSSLRLVRLRNLRAELKERIAKNTSNNF